MIVTTTNEKVELTIKEFTKEMKARKPEDPKTRNLNTRYNNPVQPPYNARRDRITSTVKILCRLNLS